MNFFIQDLIKLPSFPRKALEAELDLYHNGQMGKVGRKDRRLLVYCRGKAKLSSGGEGRYLYIVKLRVSAGLCSAAVFTQSGRLQKSPLWATAAEEVSLGGLPLLKGR